MDNIESYVRWRSDIPLEVSPFNLVDNVVLCALSYTYFKDIVPVLEDSFITIEDAVNRFFEIYSEQDCKTKSELVLSKLELMRLMANSKRYKDMRLSNYIDIYDENEKSQFAAFHVEIDEKHSYIAIRGTDMSIIGWQEDFRMAHEIVPAQRYATNYLNRKERFSEKSQFLNGIVDDWIKDASLENREAFANDFFDALKAGGAKDFTDLTKRGASNFEDIILSLSASKPKAKEAFAKLLKSVYHNSKRLELKGLIRDKNFWTCLVFIVMGFIMIASPEYALEGIGKVIVLAVLIFMLTRIYKLLNTKEKVIVIKKTRFLLYLIMEAFIICLFLKQEMLTALMNLLIGGLLVYTAYQNINIVIFDKNATKPFKFYLSFEALISFLIGSVTIVLFNVDNTSRLIVLGTFLVIMNIINIIMFLYRKMKELDDKNESLP